MKKKNRERKKKRRIEKLKEEIYQFNNNEKTKWEIERENQMKNFVDEKRKLIEELEFLRILKEDENRKRREEKEWMEKTLINMSSVIKLNVGGTKFTTSRSTLSKHEGYFKAMFSGRHSFELDEEGYYFIDRDGTYFPYILNYLRDGTILIQDDNHFRYYLTQEAQYYCLDDLVALLNEKMEVLNEKMEEVD